MREGSSQREREESKPCAVQGLVFFVGPFGKKKANEHKREKRLGEVVSLFMRKAAEEGHAGSLRKASKWGGKREFLLSERTSAACRSRLGGKVKKIPKKVGFTRP